MRLLATMQELGMAGDLEVRDALREAKSHVAAMGHTFRHRVSFVLHDGKIIPVVESEERK